MAVSETIPSHDKLFGIPLGEFGLFPCLFLGVAFGVASFFATCFFAIFGLFFYNEIGHHAIDLADAYRDIALPVGAVALVIGVAVMFTFWLRRKLSHN